MEAKLTEWLTWDKNESTKTEIQALKDSNNVEELEKRLCKRMEFGTAGLRARMGAGYSMMNDLTIIQTTQGFAKYMLQTTPDVTEKGVVIGYDARHNSSRFARRAATVLLSQGIPVYLYSQICPTPFVPYAVLKLETCWGIMVTASHNPKDDNGYKVYYRNGAQIIPPHDSGIADSIVNNLEPWSTSWDLNSVDNSEKCMDKFSFIQENYMNDLMGVCNYRDTNKDSPITFTYTAMHGVGYQFIQKAFDVCNFKPVIPTAEQVEPDPEFPTVKFPNPEEGKSALDLAIKTAEANKSTVILANDPDADRLALAEQLPSGKWTVYTGDQTGALILWWLIFTYKQKYRDKNIIGSNVYCLASTVSSKIIGTIARQEGFNFVETLTGFKWMGNEAVRLIEQGKTVLFAFEEAIGFMCSTKVLDKDGISAAIVLAEMATYLARQNITFKQQLENIYKTYGYHISNNSYYICHDPVITKAMFDRLRDYDGQGNYPSSCGPYAIKYIRDLYSGYDNSQPDNKAILPTSTSSQMITFTFENGVVATIRTSGTEPKIKYYSEYCAKPGQSQESVTEELGKVVSCIISEFYQPEKNKLIPRPT